MILKQIKLHPFAGTANKEIFFDRGLNVVCGANEAGKSTLIKALYYVLFKSTKLTPSKLKEILKDVLPVGSGDTVSVDLVFEFNGQDYTIRKKWGGTCLSQLESNTGTITDPDVVHESLQEILSHNEATWKNVLFAHQAVLANTIKTIKEESEITNSFNGILRSAVMLQGGISPEEMKGALNKKISDLTGRWDFATNKPKISGAQGDHDNPWRVGFGTLVSLYYKIGTCKKQLQVRNAYDHQLDKLATELEVINRELVQLESFVKQNEVLVNDLRVRKGLEAEKAAADLKLETLSKHFREWNKIEVEIGILKNQFAPLDKEIVDLKNELQTANKRQSITDKKRLLQQINEIDIQLNELEQKSRALQKVDEADLAQATQYQQELDTIRIKLAAQKLLLSLSAKKEFAAQIVTGLEEPKSVSLGANESLKFEGSSRIIIENEGFTMSVASGDDDFDALTHQFKKTEVMLKKLLEKYFVSDVAAMAQLKSEFDDLQQSIESKKRDKRVVLNGLSYEELKKEIDEIDQLPPTRGIEDIQAAQTNKTAERTAKKQELDRLSNELISLEQKYKTVEALQELSDEVRLDIRALQTKLTNLRPLPEELVSIENFVNEFETKKTLFEDLRIKALDLASDKRLHEQSEPEKTAEELREELLLLKADLASKVDEAKAYQRILGKLEDLLAQSEAAAFDPYHKKTSDYLSRLTAGKYVTVNTSEGLPISISNNGNSLATGLLSYGTNDCLALALRLSMAEYFLDGRKGFIVLDDPLTDMDLGRQKNAAACLEQFAAEKQVLLFTCHQSHQHLFQQPLATL